MALPDTIAETGDEITSQVLTCGDCGRNYKIIAQEVGFYRKMNIPVPSSCPGCRHKARMAMRAPRKLYDRACDQCGAAIRTSYAPRQGRATPLSGGLRSGGETVYCEKCYLEAVY